MILSVIDTVLAQATQPEGFWSGLTQARFLSNTGLQWLGLFGVLLGGFVVGKFLSFVLHSQSTRLAAKEANSLLAVVLRSISAPVTMLCLAGALYVASMFMTLAGTAKGTAWDIQQAWLNVCMTVAVLAGAWFIYKMVDVVEYYLVRLTSKTETHLDDQLVPLVRKTLRVFVVIMAMLFIGQNIFRWDIGALIAGLGIGGLAFALAAKDLLANLFGSVAIFADHPFQMKDRVIIGDHDGTVEEVGFRSTRLRLLSGNLVTVPNSIVANTAVENVSARPFIKRVLNVTVTYDTKPAKLQRGVEILREMLDARMGSFHPDNPPRVFFSDFNSASLNIVVYYYFAPPLWWDYMAFTHDFNMELLQRFNDEGIEFAFPTSTLYVKQDSPIEADVRVISDSGRQRTGEAYT